MPNNTTEIPTRETATRYFFFCETMATSCAYKTSYSLGCLGCASFGECPGNRENTVFCSQSAAASKMVNSIVLIWESFSHVLLYCFVSEQISFEILGYFNSTN